VPERLDGDTRLIGYEKDFIHHHGLTILH
jgi:hypothetical protein